MNSIRAWLFKKVFSDLPPFKWIDGHKEEIAKVLTFIFAISAIAAEFFPQYALIINESVALIATIASALGILVAKVHSADKKKYYYGPE